MKIAAEQREAWDERAFCLRKAALAEAERQTLGRGDPARPHSASRGEHDPFLPEPCPRAEVHRQHPRRLLRKAWPAVAAAACLLWALPATGPALQLPPEIQADRYLLQAEEEIQKQDYVAAKAAMDQILALQREHGLEIPEAFHFRYAQVSERVGQYEEAIEFVTRYLTIAGRQGEHYQDALRLLNAADAAKAAAEAARKRVEEERRRAAEAFEAASRRVIAERKRAAAVVATMEFVLVPSGEFLMGSRGKLAHADEQPVTRVRISEPFYLSKYEVTQGQWEALTGSNPSRFKNCGRDCPVESVSWEDVQEFIERLNARAEDARYRLPTEAEWEYAARAGSRTDTPAGDLRIRGRNNAPVLDGIARYGGNSGVSYGGGADCSGWEGRQYGSLWCGTHPVGGKAANAFGLHDMLGNVSEWVQDWYGDYPGGSLADPTGPISGSGRVHRGGGWADFARSCRASYRNYDQRGIFISGLGFRLVRTH